jgi:hypothetical protein
MPDKGTKVKVSWDTSSILSNVKGIVKIFDLQVWAQALIAKLIVCDLVLGDEPWKVLI